MNLLLYSPDNGVTHNFMPHLWIFLLQALTLPCHRVFLIDGNAQLMTGSEVAAFVRANRIELVGIGAMTRMAARAYKMADAIRGVGAKVAFRGTYFPQIRRRHWFSLLWSKRQASISLSYEAFPNTRAHRREPASPSQETA